MCLCAGVGVATCACGAASPQLRRLTRAGMVAEGHATPERPAARPHRWSLISDTPPAPAPPAPAPATAPSAPAGLLGASGATFPLGNRCDCRPEAAPTEPFNNDIKLNETQIKQLIASLILLLTVLLSVCILCFLLQVQTGSRISEYRARTRTDAQQRAGGGGGA